MKEIKFFLNIMAVLLFSFPVVSVSFAAKTDLGKWMGKHCRVVWVQDQGKGSDTFARSNKLMLYGYDSEDGRGERLLVPGTGNYFKPLFTPDGKKVIVSNRNKRQMYLVDWESGKVTKLGAGVAVAVWEETTTRFFFERKQVWVYCFLGLQPENKYGTGQHLYRFRLDKPKKKELIWKSSNMAWSSLQLSRDGKILGGLFPWPHGGVLHTDTKKFHKLGRGCWTSLSPDNSKLLWIFDGLHRNIQIYDVLRNKNWKVNINGAPGIRGFEVYHPRWSNHPRYFVITGPYEKGEGGNRIGGGGEKVEIHIGRFDAQARSVEDWFQVTHNNRADFYPELWVEDGRKADLADSLGGAEKPQKSGVWPAAREDLVFIWENMKSSNQLDGASPVGFYQCNLELRGNALHSRDYQLVATGGWAESGDAGDRIAGALADAGKATIGLTVTPEKKQEGSIFSFMGAEHPKLQLLQRGQDLVLQFPENRKKVVSESWDRVLVPNKTVSIALVLDADSSELYVNGQSAGRKKTGYDFKKLDFKRLVLGDISAKWSGVLENLAVYNKILNPLAIQHNTEIIREKTDMRRPPVQLTLEGELLERTEIPDPGSIGAYRRALVVNSYLVKSINEGEYPQQRILVAEWAVLDRKIVKTYGNRVVTEKLVLERFDEHPELEGERQMMDVFEPELDMYYRVPSSFFSSTMPGPDRR